MTVSSETEICNLALTRLGHSQIVTMDEGTKAASLCSLHYPICRDATLRAHPWNFAIYRVTLALDATAPNHEFGYRHALPTDCLKVIRTGFEADGYTDVPYRIEGRYLLCDETVVTIEYIAKITDVAAFDPMFVDLLAQRLAAEIAVPLTDTQTLAKAMWDVYGMKLSEARTTDAQEGTPREVVDLSSWIVARY